MGAADGITVTRVAQRPRLEDFVAGGDVPGFARITDFRQNRPNDGSPASRETIAWVAWDEKHFYAAFLCREDPGQVRARMSRREDIFSDDEVGLFLDTFHDRRHTYSFYANPFGIQADSINTEGQGDDYSFDTLWSSDGRLTADGYVVLMAIPFRSLRFPGTETQQWGFGLGRFTPARSESSYWPLYTSRIEGFATQLATLDGLEHISPGRNLQFVPYTASAGQRFLDAPETGEPSFVDRNELRAGLDAKVVVRNAFTLDVTLNPDFSQVESNDPQVTLNQRFEVFFPEKRPFFLDNASYFQTPQNLLFSRRIANPEYGTRFTGAVSGWQIGALAIDDRAPGQGAEPDEPGAGHRAGIAALRLQREVASQSTIGVLFTNYTFAGASSPVASVDTRLRLSPNVVLTAQAAASRTSEFGAANETGTLLYGDIIYTGLRATAQSTFLSASPAFRSALAFVPRVDIRQGLHQAAWKWRPSGSAVKAYGPTMRVTEDWDHTGALQDWIVTPGFSVESTGSTTITVERTEALEVFEQLRFRKHSSNVSLTSEIVRAVGIEAGFGTGVGVNYDPAPGLLPFSAASTAMNLRLTLRPATRIKIDQTYLFSRLHTIGASDIARLYGDRTVFTNHLARTNVNYQFTRELSLRAILDYGGVVPAASLVDVERSKQLTADFLFTWLLHPGTALYLGSTNTRENLTIVAGPPERSLRRTGDLSTTTGRQVFVKVSYLLQR